MRVPVRLQLVWGVFLLSGIFFLPESPYVLLNYLKHIIIFYKLLDVTLLLGSSRREEARTVIAALNSVPEDDGLVDELVSELDFAIQSENEGGKATWLECFSTRSHLWKAYDQRYDVAVCSTVQVERPEFLFYVILFGIIIVNTHILSQTTIETPFSQSAGTE